MKHNLSRIFGATALSTLTTVAFADGLDPTVLTEGEVIGQISRLATVTGSTASGAYSFVPEWSEELGFSATGAVGFRLQENSALGLIVTGGERKREVLLNFGLELDAERQVVLTAGQLQERLEFGTDANQEWVKQNEFGLAYETTNYAFSVYHVDSETTDNFVGAKSTGAELSGSVDVSDALTMGFGAGYQTLDWDDGSEGVNGLTASLDLGYQANATTRLNVFADRNMSENQFGFGGSWTLGAGTLDASYTFIDGRVGAVTDDNRLAVAFTMPLGGKSNATVSRNAADGVSVGGTPSSTLLADVMTRPGYLPTRVIVKAEDSGGSNNACQVTWSYVGSQGRTGSVPRILTRVGIAEAYSNGLTDVPFVNEVFANATSVEVYTNNILLDGIVSTIDTTYFQGRHMVPIAFEPGITLPEGDQLIPFRVVIRDDRSNAILCFEGDLNSRGVFDPDD